MRRGDGRLAHGHPLGPRLERQAGRGCTWPRHPRARSCLDLRGHQTWLSRTPFRRRRPWPATPRSPRYEPVGSAGAGAGPAVAKRHGNAGRWRCRWSRAGPTKEKAARICWPDQTTVCSSGAAPAETAVADGGERGKISALCGTRKDLCLVWNEVTAAAVAAAAASALGGFWRHPVGAAAVVF